MTQVPDMRWLVAWLAVVCVMVLGCGRIGHGTGRGEEGR
ncbi:putative membrane protein [Mycobacterium kansasii]|uniref:Putative membrane protein n=1 Tax=Mycobacterium kansasii TaxID=1768 RepID=A0A1V3XTY2_MYCKA|nr:putative membrane protein [Mycobacterium kansasii]